MQLCALLYCAVPRAVPYSPYNTLQDGLQASYLCRFAHSRSRNTTAGRPASITVMRKIILVASFADAGAFKHLLHRKHTLFPMATFWRLEQVCFLAVDHLGGTRTPVRLLWAPPELTPSFTHPCAHQQDGLGQGIRWLPWKFA